LSYERRVILLRVRPAWRVPQALPQRVEQDALLMFHRSA
jgi:hypothetical protein